MPLLSVKNLNVSIGGHRVIESLTFEILRGESFAILGPNGAGKTMLLRAILGLIPYSGEVKWEEGIRIGYVPQKIDFDRYLPLSLGDFLEAKAKIVKATPAALEACLSVVGFGKEILGQPLGGLSFGQFQKALIVFALLGEPDVLILDEATLGVDVPYEDHIYKIMERLRKERNMTIILVSHELEIVYRYTTKVLCLNRKMLCVGSPKEALTEQALKELYAESTFYVHHHGE